MADAQLPWLDGVLSDARVTTTASWGRLSHIGFSDGVGYCTPFQTGGCGFAGWVFRRPVVIDRVQGVVALLAGGQCGSPLDRGGGLWLRVQAFNLKSPEKLVLRPKQERLLQLLRDHGSMAPAGIWVALGVSRQGAMNLLQPLLDAGLVEKIGTKKTGRYALRHA